MKAKMLLYAASPLFNGNSKFYSDFKDKSGNALMPLTYDATKWQKAADAAYDFPLAHRVLDDLGIAFFISGV